MKILAAIVLTALVALGGYWFFVRDRVPGGPLGVKTVVAFGDSLTAGVGASGTDGKGKGYVEQLEAKLSRSIIVEARPGDTTSDALGRIENVLKHKPDIVIVFLGGNDALRRLPADETFTNLDKIITTLKSFQSSRISVLLIGVQGGILGDPYGSRFKALAKKHSIPLVPDILDGILGHSDLMSDQIHPNEKGYTLVAERIYPELMRLYRE